MESVIEQVLKDRRVQFVGIILGTFVVAVFIWWGYSSYRESVNERAQQSLAIQLEAFERTRDDQNANAQAWAVIANMFERSYKEHASSDLAPFFMVFQAEALLRSGDRPQAIVLLDTAVRAMGKKAPLYWLYATKLGVVRLDSDQNDVHEQGKKDLMALAENGRNPHRGLAWYYLWHHAWVFHDTQMADLAMTKLQAFQRQGSQLGMLAKEKAECMV
jgi:hypothetical protein